MLVELATTGWGKSGDLGRNGNGLGLASSTPLLQLGLRDCTEVEGACTVRLNSLGRATLAVDLIRTSPLARDDVAGEASTAGTAGGLGGTPYGPEELVLVWISVGCDVLSVRCPTKTRGDTDPSGEGAGALGAPGTSVPTIDKVQ